MDRRVWQSRRRLYRRWDLGVALHAGERLRWGRVSLDHHDVPELLDCWDSLTKRIRRAGYGFDYLRVVGATDRSCHAHFAWFGDLLPIKWLTTEWAELAHIPAVAGAAAWVEEITPSRGRKQYLGRNLASAYMAGQGAWARWSASPGWAPAEPDSSSRRKPGRGLAADARLGAAAQAFVRSAWYGPGRPLGGGPLPAVYFDLNGELHSQADITTIIDAL
jgi:hypothetical protein